MTPCCGANCAARGVRRDVTTGTDAAAAAAATAVQSVYRIRYRLPKDFTCDRCILQWHYLTGNSCWPPCSKEDPTFPNCRPPTYALPYCGTQGAAYPEEFWNCADIRIRA
ncbi:hypothetical protein COO60DRAFT_139667 [Scenedesmus sp. NREL 46B-D3]|nr:hypothetical protein COO60DRAFT_139667 [Scenedesmus sp. NREL 46B-D3]